MDPSRRLAQEYSDKAAAYERYWAPVIGPMAAPLFEHMPLSAARFVLDVGTGTGSHLAALAATAPRARIIGIDYSHGMLRRAQHGAHIRLAAMDAQHLGLRSGIIDAAAMVFVLFHLPDPQAGLREIGRVLRPGGTIGLVTWGKDQGVPGLAIWKEELDAHGAGPDPRDPSVMQHERMDTPEKMEALLSLSGFRDIRVRSRIHEHRWTVEALVNLQMTCGMAARRVKSLSSSAAAACQARVTARLSSLRVADLIHCPEVLSTTATAP